MTTVALPSLLVLTDRRLTGGRALVDVVRAAVGGGAEAVVLREKDLPRSERAALATELRAFVPTLIVASDPAIEADGVHLAAADPAPPVFVGVSRSGAVQGHENGLVGRSCHSAGDLAAAAQQGCDYATLSPIFATLSKPGYGPALGVTALHDPPLPVFALGGVTAATARACRQAGATGVAVMGFVMGADDPERAVKELLA